MELYMWICMGSTQKSNRNSWLRLWKAFYFSISGFYLAWKQEPAFRLEVLLGVFLFPISAFLPIDLNLKLILAFSMALVLVFELVNSSIEAVVDLTTDQIHELAKKAKDCASATVLLCLIISGTIWVIALYKSYQALI